MSNAIIKSKISLVDTAYTRQIDAWAVFIELQDERFTGPRSRFWNLMKPRFRHVEIWKYIPPGAWLRFDNSIESTNVEVFADPPWVIQEHLDPTCIRVRRFIPNGVWRERFFMGPVTCVEMAKAFLGIRNFFVRTPYQLYKYLRKLNSE